MDWNAAELEWKGFRNEVRGQWPRLSGPQLDLIAGRRASLREQISACYGITHERAEAELSSFESRTTYFREVSSR